MSNCNVYNSYVILYCVFLSNEMMEVKSNHKKLKKSLDKIWSDCVKLMAGMKSEYSGKTENLHAHHICGKTCYRLRYELKNGICLTGGEHKFIAHRQDRQESFRDFVLKKRGEDFFDRMKILKWGGVSDLSGIELYLMNELKRLKSVTR